MRWECGGVPPVHSHPVMEICCHQAWASFQEDGFHRTLSNSTYACTDRLQIVWLQVDIVGVSWWAMFVRVDLKKQARHKLLSLFSPFFAFFCQFLPFHRLILIYGKWGFPGCGGGLKSRCLAWTLVASFTLQTPCKWHSSYVPRAAV